MGESELTEQRGCSPLTCPLPCTCTISLTALSLLHSSMRRQLWMRHHHTAVTQHCQQGFRGEKAVPEPWEHCRTPPGSLHCAQGEGLHLPPSLSVWSLVHVGAVDWGKKSRSRVAPLQVPWGLPCLIQPPIPLRWWCLEN